ncbi:MAG: SDR family oxidoreductase [Gammaproteobacteria bacterium]|nr:SDR family oxidoreductase [Gammaproteobacteria bacterium]MBI5616709.1 SDR family oxidoreductase [Gammaproteobacteria bacterium]
MSSPFAGRGALVTGAASGIGRALAEALAAAGATVVLADVDEAGAQAAARGIVASGGNARAVVCDVTDATRFANLIEELADAASLDLLFNNAGIAITGEMRDLELTHWRRVVEVNLMGVVHGASAAFRLMAARGHGHIVNVASLAGLVPFPGNASYCATKHAVVGLSRSLRTEGAALGVKVSVVCPGYVASNINTASEMVKIDRERLLAHLPFRLVPAAAAAERILAGVARNEAVIRFPFYARFFDWLYRFSPALVEPLLRKTMDDVRRARTPS